MKTHDKYTDQDWFDKYFEESLSEEESEIFEKKILADERFRELFDEDNALRKAAFELANVKWPKKKKSSYKWVFYSAAAMIVLLVCTIFIFNKYKDGFSGDKQFANVPSKIDRIISSRKVPLIEVIENALNGSEKKTILKSIIWFFSNRGSEDPIKFKSPAKYAGNNLSFINRGDPVVFKWQQNDENNINGKQNNEPVTVEIKFSDSPDENAKMTTIASNDTINNGETVIKPNKLGYYYFILSGLRKDGYSIRWAVYVSDKKKIN